MILLTLRVCIRARNGECAIWFVSGKMLKILVCGYDGTCAAGIFEWCQRTILNVYNAMFMFNNLLAVIVYFLLTKYVPSFSDLVWIKKKTLMLKHPYTCCLFSMYKLIYTPVYRLCVLSNSTQKRHQQHQQFGRSKCLYCAPKVGLITRVRRFMAYNCECLHVVCKTRRIVCSWLCASKFSKGSGWRY